MARRGCGRFFLSGVFLALLGWSANADALTVYRIGGEDAPPPPEVEAGQATFVQLSWLDVDPSLGGFDEGVKLETSRIEPFFFERDENLSATIWDRDGYVQRHVYTGFTLDDLFRLVTDGDPTTSYLEVQPIESDHTVFGTDFLFDLGGLFPVQRVRFYPPPGSEDKVVEAAVVATSTGREDPTSIQAEYRFQRRLSGFGIVLGVVAEITENKNPVVEMDLPGDPVRYVLIHTQSQERIWEIAEIEIFTEGYVPRAKYRTNIIDLRESSNLGWIRWSGRQDDEARVEIRSQAGADGDPNVYWRKTFRGDEQVIFGFSGQELTRRTYDRLEIAQRGDITRDTQNWEVWSAAFDFADSSGTALAVTRPHRFIQFQVDFHSILRDGGGIDYLEFATSPRTVSDIVGEVDPLRAPAATLTDFTFVVRPVIEAGDGSFDALDLRLTGGHIDAVNEVRIGGQVVMHEILANAGNRVLVRFPAMDQTDNGELLEVEVQGEIFRFGASFSGSVINSESPLEVGQPIRPGDATETLDGNRFLVETTKERGKVLGNLVFDPPVVTPNGDGRNDEMTISYDLFKITGTVPVTLRIRDLSGRLTAEIYGGQDGVGRHPRPWTGLDLDGVLVPPGVYVCQVEVETAHGSEQVVGVVYVVY
jgi:hypothetical protein